MTKKKDPDKESERREAYEEEAFQEEPHAGAWTGGWEHGPARHSWLGVERRDRAPDAPPPAGPDTPPDEEIRAAVEEALAELEDVDGVGIAVVDAEVVLEGTVPTPGTMLEVQRVVGGVAGVRAVHNRLAAEDTGAASAD